VAAQREAISDRAPELLTMFDALVDATRALADGQPTPVDATPGLADGQSAAPRASEAAIA
jgi:hypothetical protein